MQKTKRKSIAEKSERVVTCEKKEDFERERRKSVRVQQRMVWFGLSVNGVFLGCVFKL